MSRRWAMLLLALAMPAMAQEIKLYQLAVGASVGSLLAVNAPYASSAGFDYGWDSGKERGRLLLNWALPLGRDFGPLGVTSGLELALGQATFDGEDQPMANLTPLFDWRLNLGSMDVVLETGLGVAYLSNTTLGGDDYSTNVQFSQVLGMGVSYRDWQLGARFQHLSNGNVEKPNNGQDFYGVIIKYHY